MVDAQDREARDPEVRDPEVQLPETRDPFDRLEVLKVLGDNTRYAIYLELARSPMPLAARSRLAGSGLGSGSNSRDDAGDATGSTV